MPKQVVVVGAGQGGLSAAIYAKIRGWDVLVLEAGEKAGGKAAGIDVEGFQLDPGPSILILKRVYEQVFRDAFRKMDDYLTLEKLEVISRLQFEGSPPINLPSHPKLCLETIKSLAPEDAASVTKLLGKLDKVAPLVEESVFKRPYMKPADLADPALMKFGMVFNPFKNYKAQVDKMFRSPLLRAFFYGFPSYGGQTYDSKAPGAFLIPYYMIREGVYTAKGGVRAIPEAFEKLARELGVEFRFGAKVTGLLGNKRCEGVVLENGEEVRADAVIANVDPLTFLESRDGPKEVAPSLSYFTAHWGFDTKVGGLGHHNLAVPKDFESGFEELYRSRQFPTKPIVYLNAVDERDEAASPTGKSQVFAVVTAPAEVPQVDWEGSREDYLVRTRAVIKACGIELPWEKLCFERVQDPTYFRTRHGNYKGSLYGADEAHRMWGMFPMPNRDERWENLVFCGGGVQPGAGLPMVTLSGKFAVGLLDD